jgi:hypothetical protein
MARRNITDRAHRKNLFGFGRKKTAPVKSAPRSSMTIGEATRAAYNAGVKDGDTGLFDTWLHAKGLHNRGNVLVARLKKEYERGVNDGDSPRDTAPTKRTTSAGTSYKGRSIQLTQSGAYVIPSIDKESEFDTLADAKRFLDSWGKANPHEDDPLAPYLPPTHHEYKLNPSSSAAALWQVVYKDYTGRWKAAGTFTEKRWAELDAAKNADGRQWKVKRIPDTRSNPATASAALYESFHGKPATEELVIEDEVHEHEHLAVLGRLVELFIETPTGLLAHIEFDQDDDSEPVMLCSSEDGKQLYVEGGDQAIDLASLKMDGEEWVKDRMVLGRFAQPEPKTKGANRRKHNLTYHTKKDFDNFEGIDYQHDLGEETGERPMLEFDARNKHLYVSGGQYNIDQPLLETSPGIEN